MKDALDVDVLHLVPMRFSHFEKRLPGINAGVIDQDVDMPKARDGIVDHFRHGVTIAGVGIKGKG